MPKISIITLVHNREDYLPQCLDSLLSQTFEDWECILWDDGSTDGSVKVGYSYFKKDKRIKLVANKQQGYVKSLSDAFAKAEGQYIGTVDSDDWIAPACLGRAIQPFVDGCDIGCSYTQYYDVFPSGARKLGKLAQPFERDKMIFPGNFPNFHFSLYRKCLVDQVGGVNLDISVSADYDIALRVSEIADFYYVQEPLYYYRHHGEQISAEARDLQIMSCKQSAQDAIERRGLPYEAVLSWNVRSKN